MTAKPNQTASVLAKARDRQTRRGEAAGPGAAEPTAYVSVRVPQSVWRRLKVAAATRGVPLQEVAGEAFTAWLDANAEPR